MTEEIQKLTQKLLFEKTLQVEGKGKKVIGMARYATLNSPDAEYIKVAFSDGSGMYYLLDENAVFAFNEKLHDLDNISVEDIGKSEVVTYKGTTFKLTNGNDYQFVKQFYIGTILELEGEVQFSDYESEDGSTLSFGVLMINGKRADVLAHPIDIHTLL